MPIEGLGDRTHYKLVNGKKVYLVKKPNSSGPGYTWVVPKRQGPMRKNPPTYRY